ncbi:MAG: hypothetical protein KKA62_05465 [Nanoarchaeota archaeon]|nr:hypothetical protein [Nanoarchaeota archaeon]MBU1643527.1 hypothetical protein [Nanoarchaeota archaeon]MBU1977371.1 hypothetical protein [Nanoarchaeota archaeon]
MRKKDKVIFCLALSLGGLLGYAVYQSKSLNNSPVIKERKELSDKIDKLEYDFLRCKYSSRTEECKTVEETYHSLTEERKKVEWSPQYLAVVEKKKDYNTLAALGVLGLGLLVAGVQYQKNVEAGKKIKKQKRGNLK